MLREQPRPAPLTRFLWLPALVVASFVLASCTHSWRRNYAQKTKCITTVLEATEDDLLRLLRVEDRNEAPGGSVRGQSRGENLGRWWSSCLHGAAHLGRPRTLPTAARATRQTLTVRHEPRRLREESGEQSTCASGSPGESDRRFLENGAVSRCPPARNCTLR